MQQEELRQILEKYHAGQCSQAEEEALHAWYASLGDTDTVPEWDVQQPDYLRDKYNEFTLRARRTGRYRWLYRAVAAAAVTAGVFVTAGYFRTARRPVAYHTTVVKPAVTAPLPGMNEPVAYDRHLQLPDSSVVLLRAGSTLTLAEAFNQQARRVELSGEAFFDVRTNARKPFVIKAAGVYTYVLGTTFNIKSEATTGHVTVTVASGKVRVENENRKIAILTKDQELVWQQPRQEIPAAVQLNTARKVTWIGRDLLFNDVSLEAVCSRLAARYQLQMSFDRQVDTSRRVTITDAFYGTESINEILDIVCTTLGYTYTVNDNHVTISGM
ncbi:FecR family protein [Chitinophaga sp. Mgbs1]|uniref:FecR family protein n=1 Tax=Chitinophaga solisilvae TaxID=1233460 RepID=A0A433WBI8_9BACT|nr:FecR family protein [Chitinophaga solisilvae]